MIVARQRFGDWPAVIREGEVALITLTVLLAPI